MKTIIKATALCLLFLASSCKDALDFEPTNRLTTEQTFSDFTTIEATLNAEYLIMSWGNYDSWIQLFAEVEGNLCYLNGANNSRYNKAFQYSWQPRDEDLNNIMYTQYFIIDASNNIVNHIEAVPGDAIAKNQVKGEALAMRALSYFELVRFFAKPYTNGNPATDPGVPIVLEHSISEPARNTVAEVYDQIIADLKAAIPLMTETENRGRFTADGAKALLARVYLYKGEWAQAETMSTELIDSGYFMLADSFNEIFNWPYTSEEIFTLEGWGPGCPYNPDCWDDIRVTSDLIEAYEPGDVRAEISAFPLDPNNPNSSRHQYKYFQAARISILRLGEQYLIRAEARFRQNDIDGALEDLNTLRLKRGASEWSELPNGISDILEERHRELAFEGHTVFDYWRTGTNMVRKQCNTGVEVQAPCTIEANSYQTVHPIPQAEMNANFNMVQNEGY
ncbi:MAG: RagB/SusD family nutrient uptake outer membrane protein [Bacteroidetes bacterium]|nr:MAG: RagB/SusD family nutrient uptake outer membrane protein [Bacteroidota bacterium]